MAFKINDRVRLKHDNKENPSLTVRSEVHGQRFLCISDCGQRMIWATTHELEIVESNFDLKQAIREALLSEEFLKAFAAAWLKTPILHKSELNLIVADETRPYKSWNEIIKEAFQPITTAEVSSDATLEPITGSESEAYYLNKLINGESK